MLRAILSSLLTLAVVPVRGEERAPLAFAVPSADSTIIRGQADLPPATASAAVIFVAGSGAFDRDTRLGRSGTERDLLFKDLARRMTARGLMAVRYDKRGIIHGSTGAETFDHAALATVTTVNSRDDLAAVYAWTRSPQGPGASCVLFFVHSEGMAHVARLAESGVFAPALIIGMGALMESPLSVMRWQSTERDILSLQMMDADGDGRTTNAEVEANWRRTPSSVFDRLDLLLNPTGAWSRADLDRLHATQMEIYGRTRAEVLNHADADPFPSRPAASSSYEWWKSWFSDDTPVAQRLAHWRTRISLHYGDRDSQTLAERQIAAARKAFPAELVSTHIHEGVGHSLGTHVLYGPVDEGLADALADEAVAASRACQ
ncbi:MAG: hypothetical protein QOF19_2541 [Alphaproteobacteria bacterium]|jgi:hypothetical protein|nr:hypothetical protein [Alphaproteobacteria bacterium]